MKVFVATSHHLYRQNRYRFNEARGYWEFDDGVGPWARSGNLSGLTREQGEQQMARQAWVEERSA